MNLIIENVMVIQKHIRKKAEGFGKLSPVFLEAADYALNHQWISADEDLPCHHEELMEPICQLDDRLIYETKRVFVRCSDNSLGTAHMINFYNRWKWYPEDIDVKHWMPIPDLTEEDD